MLPGANYIINIPESYVDQTWEIRMVVAVYISDHHKIVAGVSLCYIIENCVMKS